MADSITSTYAGEAAGGYIRAAVLAPKSLDGMTVKPNIKYKQVVKKGAYSVALANASASGDCDFTSVGDLTVTERILSPERFKINKSICRNDFLADWDALSMGASAHNTEGPANATDFLIEQLGAGVAAEIETTIWQGINATAGEIDGFETLFAGDSDVVDVTAANFTASNIDDAFNTMLNAVPDAVKASKDNLRLYVNSSALWYYNQFLMANGHGGMNIYNGEIPTLSYAGIQIVECPGMSDNKAVIADHRNLWFGTNVESDFNEVKVLDQSNVDGSDNINFVMKLAFAVQYGIGTEIVYLNA